MSAFIQKVTSFFGYNSMDPSPVKMDVVEPSPQKQVADDVTEKILAAIQEPPLKRRFSELSLEPQKEISEQAPKVQKMIVETTSQQEGASGSQHMPLESGSQAPSSFMTKIYTWFRRGSTAQTPLKQGSVLEQNPTSGAEQVAERVSIVVFSPPPPPPPSFESIKCELQQKIVVWHREMLACFTGIIQIPQRRLVDRNVKFFENQVEKTKGKEELVAVLEQQKKSLPTGGRLFSGVLDEIEKGRKMLDEYLTILKA